MNYGNIDKSNIITPSDMELKIIEENKKEELKDYMKDSITRKKERDFLLERDTKVVEGYSHNFLPYNKREFDTDDKESYWDLDNDILIKAYQNDLRELVTRFWNGFSGEVKMSYKDWRIKSMTASIEYTEKDNKEGVLNTLKDFVAWHWFATRRHFWHTPTTIYAEKIYKHSDDSWYVEEPPYSQNGLYHEFPEIYPTVEPDEDMTKKQIKRNQKEWKSKKFIAFE